MKCQHCSAENKDSAKFCSVCGLSMTAPPEANKPCTQCGHACKADAKFCGKCGHTVDTSLAPAATPNPPGPGIVPKPADPAPAAPHHPDPVAMPAPPTMPEPVAPAPVHKLPILPIVLGVTSLIVLISAGGIYLVTGQSAAIKARQTAPVAKPTTVAASAQPADPPRIAADRDEPAEMAPPPGPAPETTAEKAKPAIVSLAPARAPVAKPPAPPAVTDKPSAGMGGNAMQVAIDTTLEEGEKCMARKKYDCAITSANTVMRLDPGNPRGAEMKRKARNAQDRALSQIDIQ